MTTVRAIQSMRFAAAVAVMLTSHGTIPVSAQSTAESTIPEFQTDRPDFTEGALIVRRFQIESGYTFTRNDGADSHSIGEVLLRIGLTARAELRIAANYAAERSPFMRDDGFEDLSVGVKLRLQDGIPASVILATTVPTGTIAGSGRGITPEVVFILEPSLGSERVGLGLNAGLSWEPDPAGRRLMMLTSASVGLDLTTRTGVFIESYASARIAAGNRDPVATREDASYGGVYFDAGITHQLTSDLQVDFRLGTNIEYRERFFGVGISRRFR